MPKGAFFIRERVAPKYPFEGLDPFKSPCDLARAATLEMFFRKLPSDVCSPYVSADFLSSKQEYAKIAIHSAFYRGAYVALQEMNYLTSVWMSTLIGCGAIGVDFVLNRRGWAFILLKDGKRILESNSIDGDINIPSAVSMAGISDYIILDFVNKVPHSPWEGRSYQCAMAALQLFAYFATDDRLYKVIMNGDAGLRGRMVDCKMKVVEKWDYGYLF